MPRTKSAKVGKPRTESAAPDIKPFEPIDPNGFYRKTGAVVRRAVGCGMTMMDEKIKSGELPPPIPAFEGSKACGYLGSQLIEIQQKRLKRAQALAQQRASK
jgi:hypothetical protein